MKLYLLRPIDDLSEAWTPWYDKTFGFVIRAKNEHDARLAASLNDQSRYLAVDCWLDDKQAYCVELKQDGDPEVIMADEHWA